MLRTAETSRALVVVLRRRGSDERR